MVLKVGSFLLSLWSFMFNVFGFITKLIHRRLKTDNENSEGEDGNLGAVPFSRNDCDHNSHRFGEAEIDAKQETYETEGSFFMQDEVVSSESKYQFLLTKDLSGFVMDQQVISFTVEDIFVDSNYDVFFSNSQTHDEESNNLLDIDNHLFSPSSSVSPSFQEHMEEVDFTDKSVESLNEQISEIDVQEKTYDEDYATTAEVGVSEEADEEDLKEKISELDDLTTEDSDEDVHVKENVEETEEKSLNEQIGEIDVQEKTYEEDYATTAEVGVSEEALKENISELDDLRTEDSDEELHVKENIEETEEKVSPECIILENQEDTETFEISMQQVQMFDKDQPEIFYRKLGSESYLIEDEDVSAHPEVAFTNEEDDPDADYIELNLYGAHRKELELLDDSQNFDEEKSEKIASKSDSDDEDEVDILKEHQHLVQQMKMEMRYSKVKGLPTISEDCESPKSVEDMKPLRIDEKFEYKDCMAEIQKFYKSYADKMRKLDILNYQKLHAISFLQLKDSEVFLSDNKSPVSPIKPFIPKSWPCKIQRIHADSTHKLLSETYQDLELVYIGQICQSWEILNWQYTKAKELLEHDPQGYRSYIKVTSEFQQFQVLMERFVEDEPFQGNTRIQHYVKNRSLLRSLLHVPMIKDDCFQDTKGKERVEENVISVTGLEKIIKQSMQVFWEFLRSEKGEPKMIHKAAQGSDTDIRDPEDAKLLINTKLTLQQKERRLKDILRRRNCIVKKFQKCEKGGQRHALFTSQVELKLVSRVLSLSRITTDQLMWCHRKLDNISLTGRKVHVEPSFWLFPC